MKTKVFGKPNLKNNTESPLTFEWNRMLGKVEGQGRLRREAGDSDYKILQILLLLWVLFYFVVLMLRVGNGLEYFPPVFLFIL